MSRISRSMYRDWHRATYKLERTHARFASTHAVRGLDSVLERRPDDVVITFAKRTAMGRAKKGQLKDVPVDELMHAMFKVGISCLNSYHIPIYLKVASDLITLTF